MYQLPPIVDDENNNIYVDSTCPNEFCTFMDNIYVFSPYDGKHIGTYYINGNLSDGNLWRSYSFKLKIISNPPYFVKPL